MPITNRKISLFVLVFLLAACTPAQPTPRLSTATAQPAAPTVTRTTIPTAVLATPTPVPTATPTLTPKPVLLPTSLTVSALRPAGAVFEPIEFAIETDGTFENPFDPQQVTLQLELTAPDSSTLSIPAFWYQDFSPSGVPISQAGFRARFTPTIAGEWQATAALEKPALRSPGIRFTVRPDPKARGFVRLHPQNPRYFAFDNGQTFFPLGINMGWGASDPLGDYTRWLDRLSANGGSIIRVWMASWSFGIEWNDTPLGDYSNRLYRAWLLDQVFRLAEERGVYIELVLLNHGAFSMNVNPEWQDNPYNLANGGPLATPEQFATDPQARALFERRLRYIAARWAYSPNLFAWEWWNEANWTPIPEDAMIAWIRAMTPILKANDPYQHLISTSYANGANPRVNNLEEIDFAQLHLYDSSDPAFTFPELSEQWFQQIPAKPILFAEFGANAGGENSGSTDRSGLHLHNSLWAATFNGFASPAMYWWWDLYVDPLNLWPVFGRLNRFLDGEDLAVLSPVKPLIDTRELPLRGLGDQRRLLVWFHDRKNNIYYLEQARNKLILDGKEPGPDWVYRPEPRSGNILTLDSLQDGNYIAYWYQPMEGRWFSKSEVRIRSGSGSIEIPEFTGDLAVKILPATMKGPELDP